MRYGVFFFWLLAFVILSGCGAVRFDVTVKDNYDQDIRQFREKYPVLEGQEITKRILPQWTKPKPKV